MHESDIEHYLCQQVALRNGIAFKFTSPQRCNVPDRICLLPDGHIIFVELKAPGKKANDGQLREHNRIRNLGFAVNVCDSFESVDAALEWA